MKIRLLDFANNESFIEIPDETTEITIEIISGDMVMTSPVHFDSSNCREMDFYDGELTLKKKDFHILDEISSSDDLLFFNIEREEINYFSEEENFEEFKELRFLFI